MIISPPFLPARTPTQSESAWLDSAFVQPLPLRETNAPAGSYPLGIGLAWHNGLHMQGAANANNQTPVHAIADGEVIYVSVPRPSNTDPGDAQNFNPFPGGAAWTDNGLVILRHQTEIGANGNQPTTLTYFSAYMHLKQIGRITPAGQQAARVLQINDRVYRKEEIGKAGQIYGHAGQIHLEICLDTANLRRLIGRPPTWVDPANIPAPTADGRIDAVFGAIWFYLPVTTPTRTSTPTTHLRAAAQTSLEQAVWVRMYYEGGSTRLEAYDNTGRLLGQRPETNGEYDLYRTASSRHESLAANDLNSSSPSGWYELLRFGRNLGRGPNPVDKDPLPANAAHWRQINLNGQDIWVDLNTAGSYKFSDADFLPIQGWNFIDDDSNPNDQRCDSERLKSLIADPDPNTANRLETATLERRLGDQAVMRTLRRMICRFPSEWERDSMPTRYGFVRELPAFRDAPGAWEDFLAHLNTVTFTGLPADYLAAEWRVHPKEFIGWMRQCGWLSQQEMRQLVPSHSIRTGSYRDAAGTRQRGVFWEENPRPSLIAIHQRPLNRVMRKYGINTPIRMAGFFGNSVQETGWFRELRETGGNGYWYSPWFGRGFLQLTHPTNYVGYWRWRGRSVPATLETGLNDASRQAHTANSSATLEDRHFVALTAEMVSWRRTVQGDDPDDRYSIENVVSPSDSAGYYWLKASMARYADDTATRAMERVVVATVDTRGRNAGNRVYYRSQNFWQVSAAVNLPGRIGNTNYQGLNGFDSRCCAWAVALAVLAEYRFPNAQGNVVFEYPEGYVKVML